MNLDDAQLPIRNGYGRDTLELQELFLAKFAQAGTILHACQQVGINRQTVRQWQLGDMHGFRNRFEVARDAYSDHLQQIAEERIQNPDGRNKTGTDYLLVRMLEAHRPEYRKTQPVDNAPAEITDKLTKLAAAWQINVNVSTGTPATQLPAIDTTVTDAALDRERSDGDSS